jgi:hypothetical protein
MTAYVAKPPMKSAVLFGWEDRNGLVPVYRFKGQMSSDFLISRQLGKGKGLCKIDFAQNKCILSCTQIFLCKYKQGLAKNQKTSGL